ncbi:hypothetical protein [Acetivibrio cellulolyticus]|uniref:hypothetical protein n=1 Tax=Acetivibrio cellulolyticus TaxID=35830 RepID=UPI0001E2FB96|nr:hypothetical protein [Acetivibrio cellulolyticus]
MIITKDTWIRFIYTITISAAIYLSSTLIFTNGTVKLLSLLQSILLGVGIWFFAEVMFALAQKVWPLSNLPSYIVLILIIGIGTSLGSYILGVHSILLMLTICLSAEIFGVLIVFLYQKHYKRVLNEKLKSFKDEVH